MRLSKNLPLDLEETGRRDEALAAIQEPVIVRRRPAAVNPAAYEPDLASLNEAVMRGNVPIAPEDRA